MNSVPSNTRSHDKTDFAQRFPEAGEVKQGSQLTAEQARQFSEIMSAKVFQLSQKEELTSTEKTFVDRMMDLTARTITYTAEQQGLQVVDGVAAKQTAAAVWHLTGESGFSLADLPTVLNGVAGGRVDGLRQGTAYRTSVEDIAGYGMQLFGQMAEAHGGIEVDGYLDGTFMNMVNLYESVDNPELNQ